MIIFKIAFFLALVYTLARLANAIPLKEFPKPWAPKLYADLLGVTQAEEDNIRKSLSDILNKPKPLAGETYGDYKRRTQRLSD